MPLVQRSRLLHRLLYTCRFDNKTITKRCVLPTCWYATCAVVSDSNLILISKQEFNFLITDIYFSNITNISLFRTELQSAHFVPFLDNVYCMQQSSLKWCQYSALLLTNCLPCIFIHLPLVGSKAQNTLNGKAEWLTCLFFTSPTGSHVEWCKQLIAATISSQISGPVASEPMARDYKVGSPLWCPKAHPE